MYLSYIKHNILIIQNIAVGLYAKDILNLPVNINKHALVNPHPGQGKLKRAIKGHKVWNNNSILIKYTITNNKANQFSYKSFFNCCIY